MSTTAPVVTMKQLLEAGVHFGHQTRRWNPKMKRFIFGERNGIYIIDLQQTLTRIETAYTFVRDLVADGGTVLFIGTKKQAQDPIQSYAEKCGMPYINERWLGGMLTNFETIAQARRRRCRSTERMRASGEFDAMPKKEALLLGRELEKLERNLGGIRHMTSAARRRVHPRHEEGAHRRHRGQQARHPDRRRRRHQLRPRRHPVRDPGQRRRHPLRHADVPRHRRRRRGGPLHRRPSQPGVAAAGRRRAHRRGRGRASPPSRPRPAARPLLAAAGARGPRCARAPVTPRRLEADVEAAAETAAARSRGRGRAEAAAPTQRPPAETDRGDPPPTADQQPAATTEE